MTTPDTHSSADPMQWGDEFLLGYGPIDTVHEEFVTLLGRLAPRPTEPTVPAPETDRAV